MDELKDIWNAYSKKQASASLDDQGLRDMLKGKSDNEIDRLRKNVKLELSAALIILLCFPFAYYFTTEPKMRAALIAFGLLSLGYTFYYYQKSVFLHKINLVADKNLKTSLATFVAQLESFVKFYYYGYLVLVPITSIFGYIFGFYVSLDAETTDKLLQNPMVILLGALSLIGLNIVFYFFLKWYLHKLFGVYLERLKGYLADLAE